MIAVSNGRRYFWIGVFVVSSLMLLLHRTSSHPGSLLRAASDWILAEFGGTPARNRSDWYTGIVKNISRIIYYALIPLFSFWGGTYTEHVHAKSAYKKD